MSLLKCYKINQGSFCFSMPANMFLGLCGSLLSMQRDLGRDSSWSLWPRQLLDSSSVAGRWNLFSSCQRLRIPLKHKTAWSSLRKKCRLWLMLLMCEFVSKRRNRRMRLWQGGFGFSAINSDLSREKGLHPVRQLSSLGLWKNFPWNCSAVLKISPCQHGWCVQPNAKWNTPDFGAHQWEKTWGVYKRAASWIMEINISGKAAGTKHT